MNSTRFCLLLLAGWLAFPALAQKDTAYITTRQETGLMAPQVLLSDYDRAFGTTVPARWMFKTDVANTLKTASNTIALNLGVEYKLNPALSAGLDYQYASGIRINPEARHYSAKYHYISGNLRWYYDMKRRIAAGKSASNFSGNYIALESNWAPPVSFMRTKYKSSAGFGVKFGLQRRLLRYGYFDISYGVNASHTPVSTNSKARWNISTQPKIALGFAIFKGNKGQEGNLSTACEVLKCFREERRMFKIDLYNLLNVTSVPGTYKEIKFNPTFDYEQKLGSLPFSVELGYSLAVSRSKIDYYFVNNITHTGAAELRWYFLQRRNILQGKAGNNLSGLFAGIHSDYEIGNSWSNQDQARYGLVTQYTQPALYGIVGIQQRIFDRGFVQIKLGVGESGGTKYTNRNVDKTINFTDQRPTFNLFSEFKAGLAF